MLVKGWELSSAFIIFSQQIDTVAREIEPFFSRNISSCGGSMEISCIDFNANILAQAIYETSKGVPYLQLYDLDESRCLSHLAPSELPISRGNFNFLFFINNFFNLLLFLFYFYFIFLFFFFFIFFYFFIFLFYFFIFLFYFFIIFFILFHLFLYCY